MSTMKDKKASLAERLAKQKAKQQKQVFIIPKIKPTASEQKAKYKKTIVATEKSIVKTSKEDDAMREFLSAVNSLTENDFEFPVDKDMEGNDTKIYFYPNKIINDGYKLYVKKFTSKIHDEELYEDEKISSEDILQEANDEWESETFLNKLFFVIEADAVKKNISDTSSWNRQNFVNDLKIKLRSPEVLKKFIEDYLNSSKTYTNFMEEWESYTKSGKDARILQEEKDEEAAEETIAKYEGKHLDVTEEEQDHLEKLKEKLEKYEQSLDTLEKNIETRESFLDDLSHEELVQLAIPIIGMKTNEQIIGSIINTEFGEIERQKYKEVFGPMWEFYKNSPVYEYVIKDAPDKDESFQYKLNPAGELIELVNVDKKTSGINISPKAKNEYDDFMLDLNEQKANRAAELLSLSRRDLVSEATVQKTKPFLIKLILSFEFDAKKKSISHKLFKLSVQIKNLSRGKFVPVPKQQRKLTYTERIYRIMLIEKINQIEKTVRKTELESWPKNKLVLHAQLIGATTQLKSLIGLSNEEIYKVIQKQEDPDYIDKILDVEFPGVKDDKQPTPTVTRNEMKNVLETLSDSQIQILAVANGLYDPEKSGKYSNIEYILKTEFPYKKGKTIQLISSNVGPSISKWSYNDRKKSLEKSDPGDIRLLAHTMGIKAPKNISNNELIREILEKEQKIAYLVPQENIAKEKIIKKISKITKHHASRYWLWSLEELQQRLDELSEGNQEYWEESEKERMIKKLGEMVDLNSEKYANHKTWSLKKLRNTLTKLAGPDWESFQPLQEDFSFVDCITNYKKYDWIKGRVTGVWLASPSSSGTPKANFINKDVFIEEDGQTWYQANKQFFVLQCNKYKDQRTQNGDILTCYTQLGKPVKFKVGFTIIGYEYDKKFKTRTHMVKSNVGGVEKLVQRTFIIQDEILFGQEKLFMLKLKQTEHMEIENILDDFVSEETSEFIKKEISKNLLEVAPLTKDYGILNIDTSSMSKTVDPNTPYIENIMKTIRTSADQTNRELFTAAANIIVYLKIPEAKIFRNNVKIEYYLPDILATLSPSEKFPEVYEDPEASEKFIDQTTSFIDNKIYKYVYSLAQKLYNFKHPTKSRRTQPSQVDFDIKTRNRLSACTNKDNVKGADKNEIVYYKENGKIYCFTITNLWSQFVEEGSTINPETGNQFSPEFIKRFDKLYNKRLASEGFLSTYFQQKYGFNVEKIIEEKQVDDIINKNITNLIPNLWDVVGKDLEELEDQLSNEKPGEGDVIDETREEEKREADFNEGIKETVDIDPNDACVYCQTHLVDDSIKTIIQHGEESRIIKFCSFKCFEKKDDWNKFKIKKAKKAKKKAKKEEEKITKIAKIAKKHIEGKKPPEKIVKLEDLSSKEIKQRRKLIKQRLKEGIASFDRIAFPLMTKDELKEIAKEKGIKIPGNLSKEGTAKYLFEKLHPSAKEGILEKKEAKEKLDKIENRLERKKREKKERKSEQSKQEKKSKKKNS